MPIRIVRLGSPRATSEGLRLGTVRRRRAACRGRDRVAQFRDVWLPDVAPSEALLKRAQASLDDETGSVRQPYRGEMKRPEARRLLDLLAALSHDRFLGWLLLRRRSR
jgi:uncharacterized protein YeaO (DUF488 family)